MPSNHSDAGSVVYDPAKIRRHAWCNAARIWASIRLAPALTSIIHLSETALIWYPSRQSGIRCTLRKQQDLELVAVQQNSRSQGKIATNLVQTLHDLQKRPMRAYKRIFGRQWLGFSRFFGAPKLHHTSERAKSASQASYCFNSISPSLNMISRLCWSDSTILLHGYVSVQPLGFEEKLFGVCTVRQSL
ncbi:unnamed protein product [Fusarium fujikuroi]|nr:unnamed protein product [Fusarium fujikuroi]